MAKKTYDWEKGAVLEDHSRTKHKILREYLADYLDVRCSHPAQTRFRLAIVDGFAGAGRYECGAPGSPIIFLEALQTAAERINTERAAQGKAQIEFDLLLIVNDATEGVIRQCESNMAPMIGAIKDGAARLNVETIALAAKFEAAYPVIKHQLANYGYASNVIFNLDQYGHSQVALPTLTDILRSYPSAEIFYTFSIEALLSYLPKSDRPALESRLAPFEIGLKDLDDLESVLGKNEWLGAAERLVFDSFRGVGAFTSPFSIHNPNGWRYWMIHFAVNFRARQVYNDVLHRNASMQAHYGRSGLRMLSYNPEHEGMLYLFEDDDRERAKSQLHDDIPRAVAVYGDAIGMGEFYQSIYNETPSHSDDIHAAIIENPDVSVVTSTGGERRVANTISREDTLIIRPQKSFFSILWPDGPPKK